MIVGTKRWKHLGKHKRLFYAQTSVLWGSHPVCQGQKHSFSSITHNQWSQPAAWHWCLCRSASAITVVVGGAGSVVGIILFLRETINC